MGCFCFVYKINKNLKNKIMDEESDIKKARFLAYFILIQYNKLDIVQGEYTYGK